MFPRPQLLFLRQQAGIVRRLSTGDDIPSKPPVRDIYGFFEAIRNGSLQGVQDWIAHRWTRWPACDEAGISLAERLGHHDIVRLLEAEHAADFDREALNRRHSDQSPVLVRRTTVDFDRNHYFDRVMLETWVNRPLNVRVCYRSPLEFPWLGEPLEALGGKPFQQNVWFAWDTPRDDVIRQELETLTCTLRRIGRKDGQRMDAALFEPILQGLSLWSDDRTQDLYALAQQRQHEGAGTARVRHSYEAFVMYDSATHFHGQKLHALLRGGIDPDLLFCSYSPLRWAILNATNLRRDKGEAVFREMAARFLETVKILLWYGADPHHECHGETVMEHLARYHEYIHPDVKPLFCEALRLLTAACRLKPHIRIHPQLYTASLMHAAVRDVNAQIEKTLSTPARLASVHTPTGTPFTFSLSWLDGGRVEITSMRTDALDETLREALTEFFVEDTRIRVPGAGKADYFRQCLSENTGLGVVDIIRRNGLLCGFLLSEIIPTRVPAGAEGALAESAMIFHARLALARGVREYPGLMRMLTWARGFAGMGDTHDTPVISYSEVASSAGFLMTDRFRRFPEYSGPSRIMPAILTSLYQRTDPEWREQENCYESEPLEIQDSRPDSATWQGRATLARERFFSQYHRPGRCLAVAFENDAWNMRIFRESLESWMDEPLADAILAVYRDQNARYVSGWAVPDVAAPARFSPSS